MAIDLRPCLGDPAFDAVDWCWPTAAVSRWCNGTSTGWRAAWMGSIPDRAWARCQALAVVLAVSLFGRGDDPAGEAMLAMARVAKGS